MKPFPLVAEDTEVGDNGLELEWGLSIYLLDGSCLIGGSDDAIEFAFGKDNDRNWLGCRSENERTEVGLLSTLLPNVELREGVVLGLPIFESKPLSYA